MHFSRDPQRKQIRQRLTELWNYERVGLPRKEGDSYFYTHNDGLQNQSVLYVADSLERGTARPARSQPTIARTAPSRWPARVSDDGNLLAYGLASGGSDWNEWKVRPLITGHDLDDHLKWVKFSSASWTKDDSGFYYSRYDEPPPGQELHQRQLLSKRFITTGSATPQSKDTLVYERKDHKDWGFDQGDRRWPVSGHLGLARDARKNQVFYPDLTNLTPPVVELLDRF